MTPHAIHSGRQGPLRPGERIMLGIAAGITALMILISIARAREDDIVVGPVATVFANIARQQPTAHVPDILRQPTVQLPIDVIWTSIVKDQEEPNHAR